MSRPYGLITIGQTPREDITADLDVLLPSPAPAVQHGLLDDRSLGEIEALAPGDLEFPLVTRLRDGSSVVVAKERLVPLLERAVRRLENDCDVILVLCAGPFSDIPSKVPLLFPSRLLEHFVRGIAPCSATVLVPHEGQVPAAREHWGSFIESVSTAVATPYPWSCPDLSSDLVIMDCLGYTLAMKEDVRKRTGARAVLVRSVAASALRELLR